MQLHVLAKHLQLGVVVLALRTALQQFADQQAHCVVLDLGFIHQRVVHAVLAAGRIEDFLFQQRMDHQRIADLPDQFELFRGPFQRRQAGKHLLDLAVVSLEQGHRVGLG